MGAQRVCSIDAGEGIVLMVANVENDFIGMSLTEKSGLNMRRVAAEIKDIKDLIQIRDLLNGFLKQHECKEAR